MSNKKRYETGSRNVFKDIGVPNAEEHLVKAQLVFKIDSDHESSSPETGRGRRFVRRPPTRCIQDATW